MRVLDIGTCAPELACSGAEMVDGNVDADSDPDNKIIVDWVGVDDSLTGTYDLIMMTHSLRYNACEEKMDDTFPKRLWELTHKGSWIEIVDWLEDAVKSIPTKEYMKRTIDPLVEVGFKLDIKVSNGRRLFVRLHR